MTTERQIAANQRNARKSTGPRSASGSKRSSQNAYRHGLTKPIYTLDFERQLESLARQIAGDAEDAATLGLARVAAEAQLELARVRHLKTAMIERVIAHGDLDSSKLFRSELEQIRWKGRGRVNPPWPVASDPLATMPKEEPSRLAEATRRLLPEFVKLLRYEHRAAGRRNRAIRKLSASRQG